MENILNEVLEDIRNSIENLSDISLERLFGKYTALELLSRRAFKFNVNKVAYQAQKLQEDIFDEVHKRINGGV